MNRADIRAWLASDRDFAQGVALYAQEGTSATYARLFGLGATEYSRGVLARELSALVGPEPAPAVPVPAPSPVPVAPVVDLGPPQPVVDPSPLLQQLEAELRQVRDERSHTHPQLTARGTGQKRRLELAARIVALTHRDVELQALLQHVREHGHLPGPRPLAEVEDAGELQRRLLNLRSRRSKLRQEPARAAELAQVQADIDFITTKLKR